MPRWHRWSLAVIIAGSAALTLFWVFLVPIYQAADEPTHLDYALDILSHRGLFHARHATFETYPWQCHPYSLYLRERTQTYVVAFHADVKMPAEYGTRAYFRTLNREAPPWKTIRVDQPNILFLIYPFGYYALLAGWIELLQLVSGKIIVMFFGARIFSVLLLVCSLLLTLATLRLLN
jgi:hypothetical protein